VVVSFSGGGNMSAPETAQNCHKSLTIFTT